MHVKNTKPMENSVNISDLQIGTRNNSIATGVQSGCTGSSGLGDRPMLHWNTWGCRWMFQCTCHGVQ